MNRLPLAASLASGLLVLLGCSLLVQCGGDRDALGQAAHTHTEKIVGFGPRPPESEALARVLGYLTESLAPHGWITQQRSFVSYTPRGNVAFTNLVARYAPAGEQADTWTRPVRGLLCCHIDSKLYTDRVFVGADDAASAAGAILVLADWLAESPERAREVEIVFFDGEEAFGEDMTPRDGLYGSRRYAADWRRRETKPEFGILLDMIGHHNLSIKLPSDSPPDLAALTLRIAEEQKVDRHFGVGAFPVMDDHVPLNNAGIPTIDLIGDFASSNWWHTSRDNMDLISTESLGISIRVVQGMLEELLP